VPCPDEIDEAGINRNYVGQIEREEKSPTVDLLEKVSKALSVEAIQLFRNDRG
jgi:transcriptional regulator with XRE-family HTH domain